MDYNIHALRYFLTISKGWREAAESFPHTLLTQQNHSSLGNRSENNLQGPDGAEPKPQEPEPGCSAYSSPTPASPFGKRLQMCLNCKLTHSLVS